MKKYLIISIILILVSLIIVVLQRSQSKTQPESMSISPTKAMQETDKMMKTDQQAENGDKGNTMSTTYHGIVIAGNSSQYLNFTSEDYEEAKSSGKVVFLNFYANWCPICRAEAPDIAAGFNSLTTENVIGFRVNYNDSDTDNVEKALAKEFGITYQHTKVITKGGKVIYKAIEQWDKNQTVAKLNSY